MEQKSDSVIPDTVLRELKWDSRVKDTEVGVDVDAGIVTLTGTAAAAHGPWQPRRAAR